jgi:hypothetical protein
MARSREGYHRTDALADRSGAEALAAEVRARIERTELPIRPDVPIKVWCVTPRWGSTHSRGVRGLLVAVITECLLLERKLSTAGRRMASIVLANDCFRECQSARLLAHGEMVRRASRKLFSIAIFSNARWRGEFREGVNRDGASRRSTAFPALDERDCSNGPSLHNCASNP